MRSASSFAVAILRWITLRRWENWLLLGTEQILREKQGASGKIAGFFELALLERLVRLIPEEADLLDTFLVGTGKTFSRNLIEQLLHLFKTAGDVFHQTAPLVSRQHGFQAGTRGFRLWRCVGAFYRIRLDAYRRWRGCASGWPARGGMLLPLGCGLGWHDCRRSRQRLRVDRLHPRQLHLGLRNGQRLGPLWLGRRFTLGDCWRRSRRRVRALQRA